MIDRDRLGDQTGERVAGRRRFWLVLLVALLAAIGIRLFDIEPAVAQSPVLTAWRSAVDPGVDPDNALWDDVPSSLVQLTGQKVTPPMSDSAASWVMVSALHHGDVLYVNLRWVDVSADLVTDEVGIFSDAVAIQFPAVAATSVPAICMGQADSAVNIWHWRADSQEGVATIPQHGYVDMYPHVDELHYPAAAASNPMVSSPAVQNLVAGGFGTLAALEEQVISGGGSHSGTGWSVTMARPFTPPGELQPEFEVGAAMDVAIAVWNGANGDRNGQKSVSTFVRMEIDGNPYGGAGQSPDEPDPPLPVVLLMIGVVVSAVIFGFLMTRRSPGDDADEGEVTVG